MYTGALWVPRRLVESLGDPHGLVLPSTSHCVTSLTSAHLADVLGGTCWTEGCQVPALGCLLLCNWQHPSPAAACSCGHVVANQDEIRQQRLLHSLHINTITWISINPGSS
jgi:hypothetical protein